MEIWKEIEGYENYEVSNMGNVRSLDREIYQEGFGMRKVKGKVLVPWDSGSGYLKVSLGSYATKDGKRKHPTAFVHRLVANAFLDNPNALPHVDHIDYDRSNNVVTNLRWSSVRDNILHSVERHPINTIAASKTATGYKYVTERKRVYYEVNIPVAHNKRLIKSFSKIEDAISWRNQKIKDIGIECYDNGF